MKACNQFDTHGQVDVIPDFDEIGAIDKTLNADETVVPDCTFVGAKENLAK